MEGLDSLQITEEKKKFILELLNPILEEMVAECIHVMPPDPTPFMRDWLEAKKCNDEEKSLSPEEKSRIEKENQSLQTQLNKVKSQLQQASSLAVAGDQKIEDDEEDEDDDADDEPPPGFFDGPPKNQARQSVSAEAYGEWNAKKAFVAPVVVKSDEQKERLKKCLVTSFLFSSLDDNDLAIVVGAMKEVTAGAKETMIKQGDAGDFLFVIESGKLDCVIGDKVVKTCSAGDVFGELALLYNCPRAANVVSSEPCVLWQLDRDTFGNIVSESAQKKRNRYDSFLAKVPLLSSMDSYERSQLADALRSEIMSDGQVIMTQGEMGSKFYIIEEGQAKATKNGVEVMAYKSGDYFGELALIRNQPRAATVTCIGMVRALSIDSKSFKRLLNVDELLKRSENMYS